MKTDSSSPLEKEPIAKECNKNIGKIKSASHASPADECQRKGHSPGAGGRHSLPAAQRGVDVYAAAPPRQATVPGLRELQRQPAAGSVRQLHGVIKACVTGVIKACVTVRSTLACLRGCVILAARLQSRRERGCGLRSHALPGATAGHGHARFPKRPGCRGPATGASGTGGTAALPRPGQHLCLGQREGGGARVGR